MSLYVDNARIPYGRMKMSHLIADTPEELRAACATLGLSARYIQHPQSPREHLDISLTKRAQAISRLGAREITSRQIVEIIQSKREEEVR